MMKLLPALSAVLASRQLNVHGFMSKPQQGPGRSVLHCDEDKQCDEEPLARGIDSVEWLPSVLDGHASNLDERAADGTVFPLFPLGGVVYTPNSEHVLNIFEKRYRQMYSDILMNGSKRFVVCMSHPNEQGRFARTGVVFELLELKEVSEQTQDKIKYICSHKVTGRVKLDRIVNPEVWESRETYLLAEGTLLSDCSDHSDSEIDPTEHPGNPEEEAALCTAFGDLVEKQHALEEDVRFTRASVPTLAVRPGEGDDGLWNTVRLWQSFADQRLMARQNELQRSFQDRLQSFLKEEKGLEDSELPSAIGFDDLNEGLREEVEELQKRMTAEITPLVLEATLTMQKILEASGHSERIRLLQYFIKAETKRITTKSSLKEMFATSDRMDDEGGKGAIFYDEPDAFQ